MHGASDSAGRPWAGRSFDHHDTAYADDDGSAPAGFLEAVTALGEGSAARADVVAVLGGQRLLVPLLAAAGEMGLDERGRMVDKTQELSIVTVAGPDGADILPMFSHVAAMQNWNRIARPVPTSVQRAAAAALDGPARVVVDPGCASEFVLTRPMLMALLADAAWQQGADDPAVQAVVVETMFSAPAVQAVVLATGDPRSRFEGADLDVHALVDASKDAPAQVRDAAAGLGAQEVVAERVASLAVRVHRWDGGAARLPLRSPASLAVTRDAWSTRR